MAEITTGTGYTGKYVADSQQTRGQQPTGTSGKYGYVVHNENVTCFFPEYFFTQRKVGYRVYRMAGNMAKSVNF